MRKVLVTGGSRGLGLGIVRRLVCEGYCAIAVARQMNARLASTIEHTEQSRLKGMDNERRGQVARRSALRRFPEVDDVADAVEFLLGSKARSITGTVLTVDAGSTA
jgi:3-oxoacyl-[acyl-carrier protein] reductase